jgi:antitoxin YobK
MEKILLENESIRLFVSIDMSKFEDAVKKMENSEGEVLALPGATEEQILLVEKELQTLFPPSYKAFLKKFGCLSFEAEEFYGMTPDGINANSIPSVFFATKSARSRGDASDKMILIKTTGYGPNFCIDMNEANDQGEAPVYEVPLSFKRDGQKNKVADNFADFFYNEINLALEDL